MGIQQEISRMVEMGIIAPDVEICAIHGEISGAGLTGKQGILFFTPNLCGFFGCGVLFTSDQWRICEDPRDLNVLEHEVRHDEVGKPRWWARLKLQNYSQEESYAAFNSPMFEYMQFADLEQDELTLDIWVAYQQQYQTLAVRPKARGAYTAGCRCLEAGDAATAKAKFVHAHVDDPESVTTLLYLGEALRRLGDGENAKRYLLEAEKRNSAEKQILYAGLSSLYLGSSQADEAERCVQNLVAIAPDEAETKMLQAQLYGLRGEHKRALNYADDVLRGDATNAQALSVKFDGLLGLGRLEESMSVYRQIQRLMPGRTDYDLRCILALGEAKNIEEARKILARMKGMRAPVDDIALAEFSIAFYVGDITSALSAVNALYKRGKIEASVDFEVLFGLIGIIGRSQFITRRSGTRLEQLHREVHAREIGYLYQAAALLMTDEPIEVRGAVEERLRFCSNLSTQKRGTLAETDSDKLVRAMWSLVHGETLFHAREDDSRARRYLSEAKILISEGFETSLNFKGLCRPLVQHLESLIGQLDDRAAVIRTRDSSKSSAGLPLSPVKAQKLSVFKAAKDYLSIVVNGGEMLDLAREISEVVSELDQPLLVTVLGEFNVGKSTFINALLGEAIAPMDVIPTTATINYFRYGEDKKIRVVFDDDEVEEGAIEDLARFTKETTSESAQTVLRRVKYVDIFYPLESLKHINIVDTPGLNAVIEEHQGITNDFMKKSDAVIWLFRADVAGKESERKELELLQKHHKKTLGVVNQIDIIEDEDEVEEVLESLKNGFGGYLAAIVGTSAKEALDAKNSGSEQLFALSNFDKVESLINDRIREESRAIKKDATVGKLIRVHEEIKSRQQYLLTTKRQASEESGQVSSLLSSLRHQFQGHLHHETESFNHSVGELFQSLNREFCERFESGGKVWLGEGDLVDFSERSFRRLSALFDKSKERTYAIARDFRDSFDGKWHAFFESYNPELTSMFDHLAGYYEAKLQDLDDYYESERYYFHGYVKGGHWFRVNFLFVDMEMQTSGTGAPTTRTNRMVAARGAINELREEIVARYSKRTEAWVAEYLSNLRSFGAMINESTQHHFDEQNVQIFVPALNYFNRVVSPLSEISADEERASRAPKSIGTDTPAPAAVGVRPPAATSPGFLERMRSRLER